LISKIAEIVSEVPGIGGVLLAGSLENHQGLPVHRTVEFVLPPGLQKSAELVGVDKVSGCLVLLQHASQLPFDVSIPLNDLCPLESLWDVKG
jgi:hypothetical protein